MPRLRLRPGEKVLAAFILYAALRLMWEGVFNVNQRSLPPFDVLIVFLLVMCVRLFAEYRRAPWPEQVSPAKRLHFGFLVVFAVLTPIAFLTTPALAPEMPYEGGQGATLLIHIYVWIGAVMLIVVPFSLFWLASAQHIKAYGQLDTIGMLRVRWTDIVETVRDWFPLLALIYFYGLMGPVIGKGLFGDQDALLSGIDRAMFGGHDPRVLCEAIISRPLSEWLAACYVFYAPLYPVVLALVFAKPDPAPFRELAFAMTVVLAVGYVLYTVVPAQGPVFLDKFSVDLDVYYGAWLKRELMDRTRVPRDCFPSLHTGVSLTLLWGAYRHVRKLFWVLLPIVVSIPFACVYLRYHYVIDVIAGVALFATVARWTATSTRLQAAFHMPRPAPADAELSHAAQAVPDG